MNGAGKGKRKMEGDLGSYAWFLAVVGGTLLLGFMLVYGVLQWRRRRLSPRTKAEQTRRVNEMYEREDANPRRQG